jgi:small subunit ribosomal protein S16
MVTIRLARGGSKKRPFYAIVVADRRRTPRGRFIERIGFYNPVASGEAEELRVDMARVDHWVNQGAKPSETASKLIETFRRKAAASA